MALLVVAAACSGGSGDVASPFTDATADASTGPATPATSADPADPTATDATGVGSSTPDGAGPRVTAPEGAVTLSPDGPWRLVASAPGVETPGLVYELMPGLWAYLPVEEDIDAGITWVLTAADVPVIEAYLQARLVYFTAVNQDPMDLDSPEWDTWYLDGGQAYLDVLRPRAERGEHGDLGEGVVLRPQVLGEERTATSALVVSCTLDGGVILTADGELAEGSSFGVGENPDIFRLQAEADVWRVAGYSISEDACAG